MFSKMVKASAAAVIAAAFGFAGTASATPRELTGVDGHGNVVDSGWTWDVSSATEPLVNLVFIRAEGSNFFLEKDAEIDRVSDPIVITFNRNHEVDGMNLVINDESVLNHSGVDWGAFRMELSSGSVGGTPNFTWMTSDNSAGIGDFSIDPFKAFQFYNNGAGFLVTDGTIHNGETWFPGSQSNTGLAINANANSDSFTLKEIAVPIPLPAAAWTGLSTLAGLAIVGARKRVRGLLA